MSTPAFIWRDGTIPPSHFALMFNDQPSDDVAGELTGMVDIENVQAGVAVNSLLAIIHVGFSYTGY